MACACLERRTTGGRGGLSVLLTSACSSDVADMLVKGIRAISHCHEYSLASTCGKYRLHWCEWIPRQEIVYASFFVAALITVFCLQACNLVSATGLLQHLRFLAYAISCVQVARNCSTNCWILTIRTIISKFLSKSCVKKLQSELLPLYRTWYLEMMSK